MFVCEIVSPSSDWIDAKDNFCFVKNILFKSRNCISALLYRLFCNVKYTLLLYKTYSFVPRRCIFCNVLIDNRLYKALLLEKCLQFYGLCSSLL